MSSKNKIDKPLDFSGVAQWVSRGKYYGFPDCCIDEFVSFAITGLPKRDKPRKFHGSGFVPCVRCNESRTKEQIITMINLRRVCGEPFIKPSKV